MACHLHGESIVKKWQSVAQASPYDFERLLRSTQFLHCDCLAGCSRSRNLCCWISRAPDRRTGLLQRKSKTSARGRRWRIAADRLRPDFSRRQPRRHLHLPCTYGEGCREDLLRISLIYWWKGRDSNPRPRHYECPTLHSYFNTLMRFLAFLAHFWNSAAHGDHPEEGRAPMARASVWRQTILDSDDKLNRTRNLTVL